MEIQRRKQRSFCFADGLSVHYLAYAHSSLPDGRSFSIYCSRSNYYPSCRIFHSAAWHFLFVRKFIKILNVRVFAHF